MQSQYLWKWLTAGLLGVLLTSCATTHVSNYAAQEVDKNHVLNSEVLIQRAEAGEVIVKRDQGLNTSACRSRIFVNGEPVADIAPGEKVTMYLPLGEQMLAAMATGICAGGLVETMVTVTDTRTATFRIAYGTWGEFSIQPTAF